MVAAAIRGGLDEITQDLSETETGTDSFLMVQYHHTSAEDEHHFVFRQNCREKLASSIEALLSRHQLLSQQQLTSICMKVMTSTSKSADEFPALGPGALAS